MDLIQVQPSVPTSLKSHQSWSSLFTVVGNSLKPVQAVFPVASCLCPRFMSQHKENFICLDVVTYLPYTFVLLGPCVYCTWPGLCIYVWPGLCAYHMVICLHFMYGQGCVIYGQGHVYTIYGWSHGQGHACAHMVWTYFIYIYIYIMVQTLLLLYGHSHMHCMAWAIYLVCGQLRMSDFCMITILYSGYKCCVKKISTYM